ncbi:MAG: hypothetical protein IKW67_04235 [Alphaproteobacteria bacterium]|nr:hypothetical protein [Alphaproteobacteria bacterium]
MKHQIMFSLICLSTLFLNNVFAATTCNPLKHFDWGYQCTSAADSDKKITFSETAHDDSDDACKNANPNPLNLSVCCSGYYCYNSEHSSPGIEKGCFSVKENEYCYTAYFNYKYGENSYRHPTLQDDLSFGVGALSEYDYTDRKFTQTLSVNEIYNTDHYDVETNFDGAMNFPIGNASHYATYNPVYKTKKIALIFSDFMASSSKNSIKAQCKNAKSKCYMEICDFGDLDDCVAPTIANVVGNQGIVEVNGVTYKTKDGKTLFATKFVTSPETEKNTGERYEITAGEPIPPETLKAIMDGIVEKYNKIDITTYRLTDFTIYWEECPANHYCNENGQQQCPYGMKSEAGSDDITDCYIDKDTQLCDSAGCFPLEEGTKAYYAEEQK